MALRDYYTIKEVAALLRVSDRTLQRFMAQGRIPFHVIGDRSVRIAQRDLALFIATTRRERLVKSPRRDRQ
jgi:excisionase family DNA binding protein